MKFSTRAKTIAYNIIINNHKELLTPNLDLLKSKLKEAKEKLDGKI
jgi:hypothetical protein